MYVKANSINSTNRKLSFERVRSALLLHIRRGFRTQMRMPFHCFANAKSRGNTPETNGALQIRCLNNIYFIQCHTCIRRGSIIAQRCCPKLSPFTLIDPSLHSNWPVYAAVSLTPAEVFHCFKTPDAATHQIFFPQ